jgi:uncharacterized protein
MARADDTYPEGFEWDRTKLRLNLAKHGIDFGEVVPMFAGRLVEDLDGRRDYGEARWLAYGEVAGHVIAVVYTRRGDRRRLISAPTSASR